MKKLLQFILLFTLTFSNAQCYESLSFGGTHTLALKADGTLWGWGRAAEGQLGTLNWTEPNSIQIGTDNNVEKMFNGILNTFIIKNDGTLWGVGSNQLGSLGVNSTTQSFTNFQQITTSNNWLKVAPSLYFTLAIKSDGTIWAWGQDDNNQTGNPPSSEQQISPIQVGVSTDWIDVATSTGRTSFALKADGTLWGWGANQGSLLVAASSVYSLSTPTQITTVNNWARMSVGGSHILVQKADGTLWAWGAGPGRGVGESVNPGVTPHQVGSDSWKSFSTGTSTSFGVKTDGTLWAWGLNTNGQLADGTSTTHHVPVQIGTDTNWDTVQSRNYVTSMATKTDGSVYYWGRNYYGEFGNGTDYNAGYYTSPQLTPNICVTNLSTPTFEKAAEMKMYPNPASNTVQVQYDLDVSNATVELYDLMGRMLSQKSLVDAQGTATLNISTYAAGVYIVAIRNENQILYQQKLVIK